MKLSYETFRLLRELNDEEANEIQDLMDDMDCSDSKACYPRAYWGWFFNGKNIVLENER